MALPFALFAAPVASASAALVMSAPLSGNTTNATPTFSGSTEDNEDPVTVVVHEGASSTGPIAQTLTPVPASEGLWSATAASLAAGTYTAVAEQAESADMDQTSFSNAVTFEVVTAPPSVTLEALESPSKNTKPSFKGTSTEAGKVTVEIHSGSIGGPVVSEATGTASGGSWSSAAASPALADGEYTAVAVQKSALGNGPGSSEPVTFVVNTEPPKVSLEGPPALTNDNTPSFKGGASEAGTVTVHVHQGATVGGNEVAKVTGTVSGGKWSATVSSELADGEYTAVATEPSSLDNEPGTSNTVTFVVDTAAPSLTLVGPPTRSSNTTPSFEGTTTEAGEVTVHIHKGGASGNEVTHVTFPVASGPWSSPAVSSLAEGEYTAVASEPSLLGNGEGTSKAVTFEVVTAPPSVSLQKPVSPSKNTKPSFTGATSEGGEVKVEIYVGPTVSGSPVSTAVAHPSVAGPWSSGAAGTALTSGEYTAVAVQKSALGNGPGSSEPVTFVVNTEPPQVTLNQLASPSKVTAPRFSGTASEAGEVTVRVYRGAKASGTEVAVVKGTVKAGSWESAEVSPGLTEGEYTALASEPSGLGNQPGTSAAMTFEVVTRSPAVTLEQPESPSNATTPSFSGTATADTEVVVHIYAGTKAQGTPVATATATGTGAKWLSGPTSSALNGEDRTYAAVAEQASPLGNPPGKSGVVTFVVNTNPPTVSLERPESPSKDKTPKFEGSASETTPVTVHIFAGPKPEGSEVAKATATVTGGKWKSEAASPALADGEYTAVATQPSALGNSPGTSPPVTFEVDTKPPTVMLNQPQSPSKNTTPTFTGTASASTQVVIHIYQGTKAEGTVVSTATATGNGGSWKSSAASPALAGADRTYTAVAEQPSPLGNPAGVSGPVTFVVDTEPPRVMLNQPPSPSKDRTPTFTGTGSDITLVTVHIYAGPKPEGTEVASATASGTGGAWESKAASPQLADGEYSAVATQPSSLGNEPGTSNAVKFIVNTESPKVTLEQPPSPSRDQTPKFKGTASAETQVIVHIYEGTKAEGHEVESATATPVEGAWSSENESALAPGEHTYTAVAEQASPLGNPPGLSQPVTFVVDTEGPKVTLETLETPSNDTKPTFKGTTNAETKVVVHIYEGTEATGEEVTSATATPSKGAWSSPAATLKSGEHTYTAVATEASPITNNPEGRSKPVTFVVDTEAPRISLETPETPSNDTKPSFAGATNASTPVVIHVHEGSNVQGKEVAQVTGKASEGRWTAGPVALLAGNHTYTAVATQVSPFSGNESGTSKPVTFVIDTEAPKVSLEPLETPSSNTKPTFKGTTNTETQVVVHVFEGAEAKGKEVTSAIGTSNGKGGWSAAASLPTSGEHTYTAVAKQVSPISGNEEGESSTITFVVDTEPPKLTFEQPEPSSNNDAPTFVGTTNATTSLVVRVYEGSAPEGTEITKVTATVSAGKWSAKATLPTTGEHTYTAIAMQPSPFNGIGEGKSKPVTFFVDREPPKITLNSVPRSSNPAPTFSGTTNATNEVLVHLFEGSKAEGKEIALIKATVVEGKWTSNAASLATTGEHTYSAFATQVSPFSGNSEGKTAPIAFIVDHNPPAVTLTGPKSPSGNIKPSFSGTTNEKAAVTLNIYLGPRAEGMAVATKTANVENGSWKVSEVTLASGKHTYTAVAAEPSEIGNGVGESTAATFEIDTESPTVTLEPVAGISKNTTPKFKGAASDTTAVTVNVYEGSKAEGKPIRTLKAQPSSGTWVTAAVSPGLENGKYAAVASQESSLGNKEGVSAPITFEINTASPSVTLNQPKSPSRQVTLTFSGTASEHTEVVVHVYEGVVASGTIIREAKATGTGPGWTSSPVTMPSGDRTFTAVAIQTSALGNVAGESVPVKFVVDTEPPVVTLAQVASPSNVIKTRFSGTSSEEAPVTISVYESSVTTGKPIATATATPDPADGSWSVALGEPLPSGLHTFTAIARQPSSIENGPGSSAPITFTVDTLSPTITMRSVASEGDAKPSFSGSATESTPVTIEVFSGSQPSGTLVASVTAESGGGEWTSGQLKTALENGVYTAIAEQPSALGNAPGLSNAVTFIVNTSPPTVVLETSAVKNISATLHASVDPNGGNIGIGLCSFELGTTTSYGRVAQCAWGEGCTFATCVFPSGTSTVPVYASFFELEPSTTYFYRVGAENERGTGSAVGSFTTNARSSGVSSAPPPPAPIGPGAIGVAASKSARLAALLVSQLDPSGRGAKIAALLKAGLYRERFKAPEPGTTSIRWYYLPRGAKLGGKGKHAPVLVASGTWRFSAAGVATIKIRLSAKGRLLLSHAKQIHLTATCTFTPPPGSKPTAVSRTFELKR
ncbi:MAG TPA: Ig-like domain-containing protein [Solirubrobacteraceae bacterium]|nr:Ig-like domain-containing protein [Solirubrobacteraceae bacterium]